MKIFYLLSAFALVVGCNNKTKQEVVDERFFIIGEGGGVSGKYDEYKIMENGDVYWMDFNEKKYRKAATLSTRLNHEIWQAFDALNWPDTPITPRPGNYNYYIERPEQKEASKILWSDEQPMKPYHDFYKMVEKTVRETK